MYDIEHERPEHAAEIEALLDLSFGPGRYTKAAQRLREGNTAVPELCYVAHMGEGAARKLVGSLSFWPCNIGGVPGLMLGPLAVVPAIRGMGVGINMMRRGLDDAKAMGFKLVILVGDESYYVKVGFGPVPPGRLTMPGPVDASRLLFRELDMGAFGHAHGAITKPLPQAVSRSI